jgi:hypothetical protein
MTSQKGVLFTGNEIIDPNRIIDYLWHTFQQTDKISSEELVRVLRKMMPAKSNIKVTYRKEQKIKDCFGINGYFDSDRVKNIELEICCSSYKKQFLITDTEKEQLIHDIADTLCHESIHRKQHCARDGESSVETIGPSERNYYLDPDEMFAYSVNIAHNFYRKYGKNAAKKLSNVNRAIKEDCYLADYYYWFYNDYPFKRLMKMVALNLDAISKGKTCHRLVV